MPGYSGSSTRKPAQVLADIKRGKFEPVYILFGADSAAADDLIRALKEAMVQPGLEAFDLETVHADDLDVSILLQHIRQPAVGSTRRLVVVRGLDRLASGHTRQRAAELCAGLARLPEACAVALTADYSRELEKMLQSAGLARFVVDLRQPDAVGLANLIQRRSKELGITFEPKAVELLLAISGGETTLLLGELDKLATVADPGAAVTAEDVRRLAGQSREFELNEYVGRLMRRDVSGALGVLERLRAWDEEPMKIIAWLVTAFLRLTADSQGAEEQGNGQARRCLLQLYEINRDIVSGHPEPFVLVETFTVCAACPGTERYCSIHSTEKLPALCVRRWGKRARRRSAANVD